MDIASRSVTYDFVMHAQHDRIAVRIAPKHSLCHNITSDALNLIFNNHAPIRKLPFPLVCMSVDSHEGETEFLFPPGHYLRFYFREGVCETSATRKHTVKKGFSNKPYDFSTGYSRIVVYRFDGCRFLLIPQLLYEVEFGAVGFNNGPREIFANINPVGCTSRYKFWGTHLIAKSENCNFSETPLLFVIFGNVSVIYILCHLTINVTPLTENVKSILIAG